MVSVTVVTGATVETGTVDVAATDGNGAGTAVVVGATVDACTTTGTVDTGTVDTGAVTGTVDAGTVVTGTTVTGGTVDTGTVTTAAVAGGTDGTGTGSTWPAPNDRCCSELELRPPTAVTSKHAATTAATPTASAACTVRDGGRGDA